MANEIYLEQYQGTARKLRKITPTIGNILGFNSSGRIASVSPLGGGSVQAITAAGAVNVTTPVTTIASAGAIALTLANGSAGQLKVITMITDGGDATLTPANFRNGTTITFNDVGDTVILVFDGTEWAIASNSGATVA